MPDRPESTVRPDDPTSVLDESTAATQPTVIHPRATDLALPIQDLLAEPSLASAPRTVFDGRQVPCLGGVPLLAKLGQGGMGAVYYGVKVLLRQDVAVKVLPQVLSHAQPQLVERFLREAQIASRIESPHLVRVVDVNHEAGLYYLVMEFVHGASAGGLLKEVVRAGEPGVDEGTALDICIAAATGLAAAHARGVIHRDVKPDNILVPRTGNAFAYGAAKLADLGLARSDELPGASLTGTQLAMGTPGFMAPEQCANTRKARKPADVFSLGATLYALLAGRAPFKSESGMETLLATMQQPHAPITDLRPSVSPATSALLDRCLAKDPGHRYVDAAALLEALRVCRSHLGQSDATQQDAIAALSLLQQSPEVGQAVPSSVPPAGRSVPAGAAPVPGTPVPGGRAANRRRSAAVGAAALVMLLAALAAWIVLKPAPLPAGVTMRVAIGAEKEEWFRWAAAQFAATLAGRHVTLAIEPRSAQQALEDLLAGDSTTPLWCPANDLHLGQLEQQWQAAHRRPAIARRVSLALSPMVFVIFEDRLQAFERKYGPLSFTTLQSALRERADWASIADRPEWGRLTFALADPLRHNSGLATSVLLAYEFHGKDVGLTAPEVSAPAFAAWMSVFTPIVLEDAGGPQTMDAMIRRGPSAYDGSFVYESVAVDNLQRAEGRWGRIRLVYPRINFWNEHPCYLVNRASPRPDEQAAAAAFLDFLLTEGAQRELLKHGLRPADTRVPILAADSPFVKYAPEGVRVDVPVAVETAPADVIEALLAGARTGWTEPGS